MIIKSANICYSIPNNSVGCGCAERVFYILSLILLLISSNSRRFTVVCLDVFMYSLWRTAHIKV